VQWKAFSLDQQNSAEGPDFLYWEHPTYPSRGIPALVAAKAAKNQGETLFLKFHRAAFELRHDQGEDIADREVLREIAEYAGLDLARFEEDMAKKEIWQAVGEDHIESQRKYRIFGVPSLVFENGQAIFVKLEALPKTKEEKISLFKLISGIGAERPYLLELKRP